MPVDFPNLDGKIHRDAQTALDRLKTHADELEQNVAALKRQIAQMPAPLTLEQIRAELSAGGSTPLNLTGLIGSSTVP